MEKKWLPLIIAGAVAVAGAIFAFALQDPQSLKKGFELDSLGLVLMTTGCVVAVGWVVEQWWSERRRRAIDAESASYNNEPGAQGKDSLVIAVGGLIAVLFAIGAVVTLFVVAVSLTGGLSAQSTVALATSAFGVISAVVGAYLGIKITSENNRAQTQAQANVGQAQATTGKAQANATVELAKTLNNGGTPNQEPDVETGEPLETSSELEEEVDAEVGGSGDQPRPGGARKT